MPLIRSYFDRLSIAEKIILINVFLYIIFLIITFLSGQSVVGVQRWLGLPQDAGQFVVRPWTLLTYFWLHGSWMHLFWNSVLLYFVGQVFLNLFSWKNFLKIYFAGGIIGGILFLIISTIFPFLNENAVLVGASGAIMCVLIFVCAMVPHYSVTVFFAIRVQLWHIALILILLDLVQLASSNTGGRIVHLSGALIGLAYALYSKSDWSFSRRNISYKKSKNSIKKSKENVRFSSNKKTLNSSQITDEQRLKQHRINRILEKISASGYASLTDEEKKFLFEASKEMHD